MSEKPVVIYVSRDFRNKVKQLKHELTYEVFFDNLLEKEDGSASAKPNQKNRKLPQAGFP